MPSEKPFESRRALPNAPFSRFSWHAYARERAFQNLACLPLPWIDLTTFVYSVVRLNASRRDLRARPHRERDLRLLAVVDGETLEEQAAETGASAAAAGLLPRDTEHL